MTIDVHSPFKAECSIREEAIPFILASFTVMNGAVLWIRYQLQVLYTVISSISVDVMDKLIWSQRAAKVLFHKDTVLKNVALGISRWVVGGQYSNVASRCNDTTTFVHRMRFTSYVSRLPHSQTFPRTTSHTALPEAIGRHIEGFLAYLTVGRDPALIRFRNTITRTEPLVSLTSLKWLITGGAGKLVGHRALQSSGVDAGGVPSTARLSVSSIISQNWTVDHTEWRAV